MRTAVKAAVLLLAFTPLLAPVAGAQEPPKPRDKPSTINPEPPKMGLMPVGRMMLCGTDNYAPAPNYLLVNTAVDKFTGEILEVYVNQDDGGWVMFASSESRRCLISFGDAPWVMNESPSVGRPL